MGTRWRRAFCATLSKDPEFKASEKQQQRSRSPSPSPRSCSRLSFFSGGSNPCTPRLQSQSQPVSSPSLRFQTPSETANESPRLECKTTTNTTTTTTPKKSKSPKTLLGSNPTSPRSPLKLSLFKNSFKFRSSCGICLNSVKTGHGTAIYTAECGHAFHFPCIVSHVNKHKSLICPVCNCTWKDVPFLALHKNITSEPVQDQEQSHINPNPIHTEQEVVKKAEPVVLLRQHQTKSSDSRLYDDDEPLLSSNSGTGQNITPIPEVDEDAREAENDDVEEFQGFFADPNCPCSSFSMEAQMIDRDARNNNNNVQVRLSPEAALVSASRTHETYAVVLSVKAPPPSSTRRLRPDPHHRAPIDLVAVLDVSGSMVGAKLHMLKRAMCLVISSLGSADRLSVVAFSASAKRLMPLRKMTAQGRKNARRIVDQLVCGQGTSAGEALRKATKVLEDRRARNPVASIVLLSDGQDERSIRTNKTNPRRTASHTSSTRFAHIEIPVHSSGFGENGSYGCESAEDEFAKCVGGLLSVVVRDLRIQLGVDSAEISAIYALCGKPTVLGSRSVRLGDLYAEEEKELLVELRVPIAAVGNLLVMSARCLYKDPSTQEVVYEKEQSLILPAAPGFGRLSNTPKIERLRNQFIAIRAIAESRRLVEHNDYASGHHLLASARALLMQYSNSVFAGEYVTALEVELAELQWRRQHQIEQQQQQMVMIQRRRGGEREIAMVDENGDPLTPTSAWRVAEKLAKVAILKKSSSRVDDLHGFENARF